MKGVFTFIFIGFKKILQQLELEEVRLYKIWDKNVHVPGFGT